MDRAKVGPVFGSVGESGDPPARHGFLAEVGVGVQITLMAWGYSSTRESRGREGRLIRLLAGMRMHGTRISGRE